MEPADSRTESDDSGVAVATASSPCSSTSGALSDDSSDKTSTYPFLGTPEDTFIQAGLNLTSVAELSDSVEKCKDMVLDTKEYSEERKWLVRYLIELRLRLEEAREAEAEQRKLKPIGTPELPPTQGSNSSNKGEAKRARHKRIILGHHFDLQTPGHVIYKCDRCCRNIWGVMHLWYECADCQYRCHMKCLEKIKRQCALVRVCETPFYSNDICPEVGLAAQGYRCHECKAIISNKYEWQEPRQCDYDGRYYCRKCHWDSLAIIPARVVHNWDFTERKVCRNCFSFLNLMLTRPVINLDLLNPQLFQFVEDLATVKNLRAQFLLIKQYLTRCATALKEKNKKKLIWSISSYLTENPPGLFSLKDLVDLQKNLILPILQEATQISTEHIRNCWMCKKRGHFCELCIPPKKNDESIEKSQKEQDQDILFPFDDIKLVYVCIKCSTVFHRECWMKKFLSSCPRCDRLQERRNLLEEPLDC